MTCHVDRTEIGAVKKLTFTCDHKDCAATPALSDEEIMAAGGLNKMGWYCAGGRHYCPEHAAEGREQ